MKAETKQSARKYLTDCAEPPRKRLFPGSSSSSSSSSTATDTTEDDDTSSATFVLKFGSASPNY